MHESDRIGRILIEDASINSLAVMFTSIAGSERQNSQSAVPQTERKDRKSTLEVLERLGLETR